MFLNASAGRFGEGVLDWSTGLDTYIHNITLVPMLSWLREAPSQPASMIPWVQGVVMDVSTTPTAKNLISQPVRARIEKHKQISCALLTTPALPYTMDKKGTKRSSAWWGLQRATNLDPAP